MTGPSLYEPMSDPTLKDALEKVLPFPAIIGWLVVFVLLLVATAFGLDTEVMAALWTGWFSMGFGYVFGFRGGIAYVLAALRGDQ